MADVQEKLKAWRLAWKPDEIRWREGWRADVDDARLERERLKTENRRRDRKQFGTLLTGIPANNRREETSITTLGAFGELPAFSTERDIAVWLGISLERLRWFTHDKQVDFAWHYVRYTVPKRNGSQRVILAPKVQLKAIQRKIVAEILVRLPAHSAAHGFVAGRSILTNAAPHVGKQFVLNMDLKDFFPTITFARLRGLLMRLGYSYSVASVLALLCTERDRYSLERNGETVYAALGERMLVQGAPTSPALSNILARRLDARLDGLARKLNLSYTRYADDLTFSGDDLDAILSAMHLSRRIIEDEGFILNTEKTHLYRRSGRQTVTGLVVNEKVSVPRVLRRRVRAILHNAEQTGLAAQNRNNIPNFRAYLSGLIGYIAEADRAHGQKFAAQLKRVTD